jgi:toxin CptA
MSIAVSVLVRPSRALRLLHAGFCAAVLASSAACDGGLAAAACAICGALAWWAGRSEATTRRIDLSPVGQLRLTVQQSSGPAGGGAPAWSLVTGSVLWPRLLVLRLGRAGEPVRHTVLILPDCVAHEHWRPLAVACRSLAARHAQ